MGCGSGMVDPRVEEETGKRKVFCVKFQREMPGLDAGYYRMAQIRYLKGDLNGASSLIREALRLNALEPEYYYVLARCLESSDPHRALDAVRTAVALRPGVADFQELLRTLEDKKYP